MVTTDDLDDALARARSGDEAGFLRLWRQYQPRLLRFLRVLRCDDADDVASETWLQVVRDLPGFSGGDEDFRRWLFTIGRHRAIDDARARKRRPTIPMPESVDVVADDDLVEDQVLHAFSVRTAVRLLAALPPDQAEAVALRVLAGLDTAVVAGILDKSPGSVRIALHRGLRTLAKDSAVQSLAGTPAPGTPADAPAADAPAAGRQPAGRAARRPCPTDTAARQPRPTDTAARHPRPTGTAAPREVDL
jgi:RNA polymerase sigma-70 factor (ECF subfamily)